MKSDKFIRQMLAGTMFITMLAACEKDIHKPDIRENPEVEINWETQKTTRLDVDVDDAYAGRYYYTVAVYLSNPAVYPQAKMIAGSGQKVNDKVKYSHELALPDMTETIYIAVTDPFKRRRVYAADVEGEHISYFAGRGTITKGAVETRVASIPSVDYGYGTDFVELSGSSYTILKKNITYVIKKGKTFSGSMDFPGEGAFKLYVEGTLEWNGSAVRMEKGAELYVLAGGVVKNKSGVRSLSLNNALLAIQDGGTFGVRESNTGFDLTMTNTSRLVNEGVFDAKFISMNSEAAFYNKGIVRFDKLNTENATNAVVNTHLIEAKEIILKNATIFNDCMIKTDVFRAQSNATVELAPGSYVYAGELVAIGLSLQMAAQSMWEGEKATFSGQQSVVRGESIYALFKVNHIVVNSGGTVLKYSGAVEVEFQSHTNLTSIYDKRYTLSGGAAFAIGQASASIPGSDCNGWGGNENDGEGEGDTDDGYEEDPTMPYTYLFEDNWPLRGDYDMNDVVMSVEFRNIVQQEKTKGVRIIVDLLAVGATKKLGAGFQLDGMMASTIGGSEGGQEYAVIPLFSDAHVELGVPAGKIANTYSIDYPAKRIEKEIMFNTPVARAVDSRNFNLFIVVDGGFDGKERSEVHLPGFAGTKLARMNAKSTKKYVDVETGWMWALAIPQIDFTTYPRESVQINDAYEGFSEWMSGNGVPGWYMNPVDDKVIRYQ